jgi:hypothetical protein
VFASVVGPGPTQGSERLYQSYFHKSSTFEIVSIDPDTGTHEVFVSPVKSEEGARALAVGPEGNIYLGTLPQAHILRLNPRTGEFKDMGRPSKTEQYIWQLTLGSDQKLYGCTYPSAKLIRFDPATGVGADLGRMDAKEQYARSIAASDNGFIYIGIGSEKSHLVAYEIASGRHMDILPKQYRDKGFGKVYRGEDGRVYGQKGKQYFRLQGWKAIPIPATDASKEFSNRLKDGRLVHTEEGVVRMSPSARTSETTHSFHYTGKDLAIFRLGLGPDGMIYGSTALPMHFFRVGPADGHLKDLGMLGGGEFYAFLSYSNYLLGAAYSGKTPLMIYNPHAPFAPGEEANANPRLVHYKKQARDWRPHAMITGPDNKIYLGAVAGYGLLGGPLTVWDVQNNHVESFPHVVKDQSVISLTAVNDLIVGGTTVRGGGGSRPTQREAKLFVWNPKNKQKLFETVPVPEARSITNLIAAPNGLVYGFAKNMLFVFDPMERKVVHTTKLPFQGAIYNSVGFGQDRQIWGLAHEGIFTINPQNNTIKLVDKAPEKITAGFALQGNNLYYASGSKVYSYTLPTKEGSH